MLQPGDRVRWSSQDLDGLPWSRYGFVAAVDPNGYAFVMFDGELQGSTCVPTSELVLVSVTAVELRLNGCDLLDEPELRSGLISLWSAEADEAGLDIDEIEPHRARRNGPGHCTLAALRAGGGDYVLRATACAASGQVWVRAEASGFTPLPEGTHLLDQRRTDGVGGATA